MPLYTVILDFDGGTYISQVRARSSTSVLATWLKSLKPNEVRGLGSASLEKLERALADDKPVALDSLRSTWCSSALVRGKLALIHYVETNG